MSDTTQTLRVNLIGKLFGKPDITFQSDTLMALKRGSQVSLNNICECKAFATLNHGLFGSTMSLTIGQKAVQFRYLKIGGADVFLNLLNESIAGYINDYLSRTFYEFNTNVIFEYPRDSRLEQISLSCQKLQEHYMNQSGLWETYLAPDYINKVKEIIGFLPVRAEVLRNYHEKTQLERRKDFFDRVESNPLTLEQRLGVLRSNDKNMVLAAAGTGKTSVMVAKALDLIDRGLAQPSEILVLAYNRSAAEELKERLIEKAEKVDIKLQSFPQISTFHALGRKLLRDVRISTHISVFTEDETKLKQWITSWLEAYLAADGARFLNFISLFPEPVNPFDFKTQADYERYVRDNEFRTLNGERVKGYQELLIANYLYANGVGYTYEAPYVSKRRIDIGFDYRPDFHIKDTNIYIEHFGIDRKGNTRPDIDSKKYKESIQKKRDLHAEFETTLIETFHYEWVEECLIPDLQRKLTEVGIQFNPLKPEEILKKLRDEGRVAQWSELMKKALQAIRVERLTREGILGRLENAGISQPKKFTELLDALHKGYVQELSNQNSIDFDDMIIRAIQVVAEGKFVPDWKYVLVDEFQDISAARMEFITALMDKGPQPSLTVVGDDWQSIYRFSGGKLELTTRFGELVGAYTSTKLQKTFRYNNSIADTAGQFVMENPEQYKKQIETHTIVETPQVYLLDDKTGDKEGGVYERVKQVVEEIKTNDPNGTIATYAELQLAYDTFNAQLFENRLPECLITLQREERTCGYFSAERFTNRNGDKTDEIALNPAYFAVVPLVELMQTIVHEMTHLWQHHLGTPGRGRYHNQEWADKMESFGLMPSSTGHPGGKRTGDLMADYAMEGGRFLEVTRKLLTEDYRISWYDRYATSGSILSGQNSFGLSLDLPGGTTIPSADGIEMATRITGGTGKSNRSKYTCACETHVWGKPGLNILCGSCGEQFSEKA